MINVGAVISGARIWREEESIVARAAIGSVSAVWHARITDASEEASGLFQPASTLAKASV